MSLVDGNIVVLAMATAYVPDDCYFCGHAEVEHEARGHRCPVVVSPRQPLRQYQAIGWQDYATLGLEIGCYYSYRDDLHTWFDGHTLSHTIDRLCTERPLIVSYQGAAFTGPLLWQCYRESPDGSTAAALEPSTIANMAATWSEIWNASYDLLAEVLATYPDIRFHRDAITLDQLCRQSLGLPRLMSAFLFAPLWRRGFWGQALTALQFDVWCVRALFERVCNGQALRLGNGEELTLPVPPHVA